MTVQTSRNSFSFTMQRRLQFGLIATFVMGSVQTSQIIEALGLTRISDIESIVKHLYLTKYWLMTLRRLEILIIQLL